MCDVGYYGAACEHDSACDPLCSEHGSCEGVGNCVCSAGWHGANCQTALCSADCSGERGQCLHGLCACRSGWSGSSCGVRTATACPSGCNGHGNCAILGNQATCLCHANFIGATCMQAAPAACPDNCGGHGECVTNMNTNQPECQCYMGYSGVDCSRRCPLNCTVVPTISTSGIGAIIGGGVVTQGRCTNHLVAGSTTDLQCVCKDGFSGPACSQVCPNRCNGHGECRNGACVCRNGYAGVECDLAARLSYTTILLEGIWGFYPIVLITFVLLTALCCFCCMGYIFNRWLGRFGTSAVPMWDYYAKRWRNAPLFEPIFAVPAATQTTAPPPKQGK